MKRGRQDRHDGGRMQARPRRDRRHVRAARPDAPLQRRAALPPRDPAGEPSRPLLPPGVGGWEVVLMVIGWMGKNHVYRQ